ncbi:GNAT family N-acetyltransferase [Micromonospora lupini]|uniref:Putative GCN5-related N-acetyltransferase n=1 Tax=Micromonospora lupini str. Lupac 08 TaxID=1150864 RepID=I0L7Y7_9ACTN|nr:GNAT family N-acetyltransferase [Micromonospora lupini]CCH19934.1 Putative GCN5-related N-acetyltransferase [Micromonospora lupini str. Lupac 08]
MLYSTARVNADSPHRHITRLVSQLGHPAPTELDESLSITFGGGTCLLVAATTHFDMIVKAGESDAVAAVEDTITRELLRFGTGDERTVDWRPLVRPATSGDDAALLALDSAAWTAGSGLASAEGEERTAYFSERRRPETHLVAALGDQIVGAVSTHRTTPFPEGAHVFGLWNLVVAQQARRRNIASALLSAAEHRARAQGAKKIGLRVLATNTGAVRLYERHGYAVEGRHVDEFLIDGAYVDDISMGKRLTPLS